MGKFLLMGKFISGQVLANGQVLGHGSWLRLAQGHGHSQDALDRGAPGVGAPRLLGLARPWAGLGHEP